MGGSLRYPYDGVLDKDGNLYVADFTTRKVVKFDKDGKFKNFIEPNPSQPGLAAPQYRAVDNSNNLYVFYYDNTFLKYDATGKSLGNFGDKTLGTVYSLTSDKNGNIYTITGDDYLIKYDATGKVLAKYQSKKSGDKLTEGEFNYRSKIRLDPAGNIFLFEQNDPARLQKFGADGKFLLAFNIPAQKDGKTSAISDVVFDTQGNTFVANYEHLWKYDATGKLVSDTSTSLFNAQRLYALTDGGFLQVSSSENRTGKIDASGKQQTIIGQSNSKATSQFEQASAIVVDKVGNIYVGDDYLARIQKFDKSGKLLLTIDQKSSGQDFSPRYLVLDKSGNIYAAGCGSVVKFTPEGQATVAFGKYGKEDGQFDNLSGLALDKTGNIYVGDAERGVIQKFSPSGAFVEKYSLKQKDDDKIYYISMLFDDTGNILVGRGNGNGILLLGSDGKIKGQFSPNNKLVSELSIYSMAQDTQGTIYAIESSSQHPLVVIDKQGQLKSSTGGEGRNTLEFLETSAIVIDEADNLYVAEQNGARIQRWHPEDSTLKQGAPIPAASLITDSTASATPTAKP